LEGGNRMEEKDSKQLSWLMIALIAF